METRAQTSKEEVQLPPGGHITANDEGSEAQAFAILALQQIRTTHICNEYSRGPAGSGRPLSDSPTVQDQAQPSSSEGLMVSTWPRSPANPVGSVSESTSGTSNASHSTACISTDSASSDQRLLGNVSGTSERRVVCAQPKSGEGKREEQKPLRVTAGEGGGGHGKHSVRCKRCGRCRCAECTEPRPLPTCWLCARRCVCSAESAVDYATCVCCLKALLYHCSSDDEDVCTDRPFSCGPPRCCARWGLAAALSLLLPCMLGYLPARGCLALCQACHDRAHRPGCRCDGADHAHC